MTMLIAQFSVSHVIVEKHMTHEMCDGTSDIMFLHKLHLYKLIHQNSIPTMHAYEVYVCMYVVNWSSAVMSCLFGAVNAFDSFAIPMKTLLMVWWRLHIVSQLNIQFHTKLKYQINICCSYVNAWNRMVILLYTYTSYIVSVNQPFSHTWNRLFCIYTVDI